MSYAELILPFSSSFSLQQSGAAGEGEGRPAENEIRRKEEDCWKQIEMVNSDVHF